MKKPMGMIVTAWISMTLVGCLTTGEDFPSEVDWIRKDNTSQKDVQMILGTPFAIGNSGGVPTWTYAFYKYQVMGKSYHKELKLYWHPNSVVKHFSFSSSFPGDLPGGQTASGHAVGGSDQAVSPPSPGKPQSSVPSKKSYPRY